MTTTTCTYCSHDGLPCSASSAKGYLCTREAGHAGHHAACDDEDHPIAAWSRRALGAYERRNDAPGPLEQAADRIAALVRNGTVPVPDDMDGGVTAAQVEKEAERNADGRPYCPADSGEFACSREHGHTGPHVAATCDVQNSICEVWATESPDDMDGGVTAALIEEEAEKPTASDFANAEFARHPDGGVAAKTDPGDDEPWNTTDGSWWSDTEMAANGWSPVRECPDPDDHTLPGIARAVAAVTPCSCSAQRARAEKAELERDHWKREADNANADLADLRAAGSPPLTPDAITDEMVERAWSQAQEWTSLLGLTESHVRALLTAALTEPPQRLDWLDAPAVLAWHKNDGRTEHDGTPGVKRIWSPDYRTTETWSTPSLPGAHWSELVDVEPLIANVEQP